MIPQCATCINEPIMIDVLSCMHKDQEPFNRYYRVVQDAARKHQCKDYFPIFQARSHK